MKGKITSDVKGEAVDVSDDTSQMYDQPHLRPYLFAKKVITTFKPDDSKTRVEDI